MTWVAASWPWRWLRPPWSSASNELGRRIDLDRNGLDSPIRPVATLAVSILVVNGDCFVVTVIEEGGRTFRVACIAHNTDIPSKRDHWSDSVSVREVHGRRWKSCTTAPVYAGAEATLEGLKCVQIIGLLVLSYDLEL